MQQPEKILYMSLDLEMNQPSGKIIQIGVTVGDPVTGTVVERAKWHVNPEEPLNPFIIKLTGITDADVQAGLSLADAYMLLCELHRKHNCFMNPIVWGGGDSEEIRIQLGASKGDPYLFGRRWIDVKTIFQEWRKATGQPYKGGLAKSLTKMGLAFEGRKHDAGDDALNTFRAYVYLRRKFRA